MDDAQEQKQTALLPVIHGDGITVESDGGAMQSNQILRLLSLWGPAKPARYLSAQIATGKRLEVQVTPPLGPFAPLWGDKDGAYKKLRRGISNRLTHTLIIGRGCDVTRLDPSDRTFIFTLRRDRPDQTAEAVYTAYLVALLDEPLDPSWAPWLWRRARARGEARPLTVWGSVIAEAWECDVPRTLRADITAARTDISPYGALPFPGGDTHSS